jgi:hypothetical protein
MDRLVARLRVDFRNSVGSRLCGNRQCSDHQPWNGSPAACLCEQAARVVVETLREKIETDYLSAKDPETFTHLVRQYFRSALADDTAITAPPVQHSDAVARQDRQERRPVAAPNTTPPHTTTALYLQKTPAGRRGINFGCGGMTFKDWLNIGSGKAGGAGP